MLWTAVGLVLATAGAGVAHGLATAYIWGLLAWAMVLLDRRLPVGQERLGLRLLCHVPLSVLFSALAFGLLIVVDAALLEGPPHAPDWQVVAAGLRGGVVQWNLPNYWLILGAYLAFSYHTEVQERRRRAQHLEALLTEARLSALRAQLHPHFLFNALNTVSAYVETDPQRAREMLEHLGGLLRFSLESEARGDVSLAEELQALHHYLAIQTTRFAGRLCTRMEIPPDLLDARVPGLVLQPLVENAITHGLSQLPGPGTIRISARWVQQDLALAVEDNGVGLPAGWSLDQDAGIGLSNTRSRLEETYGTAHRFSVAPATAGGVVAEIRIPAVSSSINRGGHHGDARRIDRG